MASSDPLLQPYQLGSLTLRNRIMTTAHEPAYPEDGMPKDRYRAYHVERAKAGVALTMTAGSAAVSRDSPPVFNNVLAYRDEVVGWMRKLADECHDHGCAVMIQLTHLGRRTHWNKGDWLPAVTASHLREPAHRAFPKRIEDWDIARIIRDFADAAERMAEAGLDGIELECYGHLLDQFISPATNDLEGPYNGSLENRARFVMEVLAAIRERVGRRLLVGVRYTADEAMAGGLAVEEGIALGRMFKASGHVDFLNIIRGHIDTDAALTDVIPVQGMKSAPHLDFAGRLRAEVGLPTFHAARIPDVATARHAIASGKLDMVGMTRAHMADPHIVRKIIEGREADIRPCVGATYCLDRIYQAGDALCMHNAATGRELTMPHDIAAAPLRKRVVIVGAGPAGLEAARVLGRRGYQVTLAEAGTTLGGRVTAERALPGLAAWGRVADYRIGQIAPLANVDVYRGSRLGVADILEMGADQVCIATGADWRRDVVARHHLAPIPTDPAMPLFTPDDLMAGRLPEAGHVVIYDDDHYYMGSVLAELLIAKGCRVTFLTPAVRVAEWTLNTLEQGRIQRRLMERGATLALSAAPAAIGATAVRTRCIWTGRETEIPCDAVLLVTSRSPRDGLWFDLAAADWQGAGISGVRLIGDAAAPAPIAWATYAGRRYAEELDAPDQGDALPFRREIADLAPADLAATGTAIPG